MTNIPKRGDSNFDPMREDRTKISMPTKREYEIGKFYTAFKMMKDFKYSPWMSNPDVIGPNRERINSKGDVFTPKFKRRE